MKTSKIILDPVSQVGHVDFNDSFIRSLGIEESPCIKFEIPYWAKRLSFLYYLFSIYSHFVCCYKARGKQALFLYFDNFSLFIVSLFFDLRSHQILIHNNLEFAMRSSLHKLFYTRIVKLTNVIYLEKRLLKKGKENFNHFTSVVVQHPVIKINKSEKDSDLRTIFVSSRNLLDSQLVKLCTVLEKDSQVFCNGKYSHLNLPNLICGYFNDFDQILSRADAIYLVGAYKYRCSGILYRALSVTNIHVVFSDESYYYEMSEYILENNLDVTVDLLAI